MARMALSLEEQTGKEGSENGNDDGCYRGSESNEQEGIERSSERPRKRAQTKKKANLRALIRERYASVLKHNPEAYIRWQVYYSCQYFKFESIQGFPGFTAAFKTSPKVKPVVITLAFIVPDIYISLLQS